MASRFLNALLPLVMMLVPHALAFSVVPHSFDTPGITRHHVAHVMMAEKGAPQYNRRPATIVSNTEVGRSSYLISVQAEDGEPVDYQPGNVLALEIPDPEKDAEEEAWMRGPYTVFRATQDSFDILYRVVGKKTRTFSQAPEGSRLQFGGKFKVPILEGINPEGLERVVGISTGVGVGPLIGFAEQALSENVDYKIDLFVAFREPEDISCASALDQLVEAHPERFSWTPILSNAHGHVSTPDNLQKIAQGAPSKPGATHYHLIGNGSMVNEWTEGLAEAGVPKERVTLEMYFNHKATPRAASMTAIGEALKEVAIV